MYKVKALLFCKCGFLPISIRKKIVPLAAAVVERWGGMIVHGAIIAREYRLPCVTGVPDSAELIRIGDFITVDGHLGIGTVGKPALREVES